MAFLVQASPVKRMLKDDSFRIKLFALLLAIVAFSIVVMATRKMMFQSSDRILLFKASRPRIVNLHNLQFQHRRNRHGVKLRGNLKENKTRRSHPRDGKNPWVLKLAGM
ncbi:hypothetical protein BaRGS_00040447 [Batillaria attramentaria]|uniref:Transmembrane protein n=1 Tax=Batillaria attramentaria TaxID=370345 RepID=A0ABD0J031_9CAEN